MSAINYGHCRRFMLPLAALILLKLRGLAFVTQVPVPHLLIPLTSVAKYGSDWLGRELDFGHMRLVLVVPL